ncbi:MAG: hypothetical protein ACRBDL_05985 [Alphaproteobacteria bacterium]
MDIQDVASHLTNVLKDACPGLKYDYPLVFIEYTICKELDYLVEQTLGNVDDMQLESEDKKGYDIRATLLDD